VKIEYRIAGETGSRWVLMENQGVPEPEDGEEQKTYYVWTGEIPAQGPDVGVEFRVHAVRDEAVDIEPDQKWIQYMSGRTVKPPLRITEVLASNTATWQDRVGQFDDWVEIHNLSVEPLPLEGFYLTDNHRRPHKWPFPAVTIPGEGRVLVWCDGDTDQAFPGELHATFGLNADGDDVALADESGIFQRLVLQDEVTDISYGLLEPITEPPGAPVHFFHPSPLDPNPGGPAPVISDFSHGSIPAAGGVTITVTGENLDTVDEVLVGSVLRETVEIATKSFQELTFVAPACRVGEHVLALLVAGDACDFRFYSCERPPEGSFVRGETNEDGALNISDPITILGYLFRGKPGPTCRDRMDVRDDGTVDLGDAIALLGYLFAGGPAPPAPFPERGYDPTEDDLSCPG
jgi:hypothetical protein